MRGRNDEDLMAQRMQVMGRSLLTLISQFFRSIEIYETNNQIFAKLIKNLNNNLHESFRSLNGCTIRVSRHNAYVSDQRIYIDAGMVESVQFLSRLFESADIDGFTFMEDCLDPDVLFKTLLAFRKVIIDDGAKGVEAIAEALIAMGWPNLEPLPINREQTVLTGLRDETQAEKLTVKNAVKLVFFLKSMERALMDQRNLQTNVVYRILLNMIRINDQYPHYIAALLHQPIPERRIRVNFYSTILLLILFRQVKLDRQLQLDMLVDFLFHNCGELSLPATYKGGSAAELADRGARKLLENKYFFRALFQRVVYAYHGGHPEENATLPPLHRFLLTVRQFVATWKDEKRPQSAPQALHQMMQSEDSSIDKTALILISEVLGLVSVGSFLLLDRDTPVMVSSFDRKGSSWVIGLEAIQRSGAARPKRYRWVLKDRAEKEAYMERLAMVPPNLDVPGPMRTLFKRKTF